MPDAEAPKMLTILACGYRAKCVGGPCPNLARNIFRYADAGGRPILQSELCNHHSRLALNEAKRDGLRIIDERKHA
jgi:hypothetical protein